MLVIALVMIQATKLPDPLNDWVYDRAITAWPAPVDNNVVIIAIDEFSLEQLGRWPWDRDLHASLIDKLHQAGAATVVMDILFTEPGSGDNALAEAMERHGRVALPVYLSAPTRGRMITEHLPTASLTRKTAALGHAHIELDNDGVARGLYLYNGLAGQLWPALSLAAEQPHPRRSSPPLPGYTNVRQDYRLVPLAGGAGTIPTYSYANILNYPVIKDEFTGKTVFVGATAAGFGDILPTPFSGLSRPMSGVEFHANVFSASQQHLLISQAPDWAPPGPESSCPASTGTPATQTAPRDHITGLHRPCRRPDSGLPDDAVCGQSSSSGCQRPCAADCSHPHRKRPQAGHDQPLHEPPTR
ncbi:CHASE2 domain-containing protein [Marinobacter daepoensis]|uniref:CHASE2 domain-containing protein n=1 Tax=Marinobacter daepoensis TaxID=262077 RepID=UPI001D172468|nr:CHASE2 domain-containing protein [Marinobacter daepoensis]